MQATMNRRELIDLAKHKYETAIRAQVEPDHVGKFVVIDVHSGDFEVDADKLIALDRLKERRPAAQTFVIRVGYPTAAVVGGAHRQPSE